MTSTPGSHELELRHGGNLEAAASRLGCQPHQVLDASASLVPFGPPASLRRALRVCLQGGAAGTALRDYPDRSYSRLRSAIAAHHGIDPAAVLPGNGAAELFTWAAREAAEAGPSLLPEPGFADYRRALACWDGAIEPLPLPPPFPSTQLPAGRHGAQPAWACPAPFPAPAGPGAALWITNPHNPSGQLWDRRSLELLLDRFALVIVDEAFLPLVPDGERHSLVPLVADHPQLVVIRSLTKLMAIAGLRLGYAVAAPARLQRWQEWRDPWPVNGLAAAVGPLVIADWRWQQRVQRWVAREGPWFHRQLDGLPGLSPQAAAANFLLMRSDRPLLELRERLERRHRILLRDCRSFAGLGECWLRIGLQDRRGNRRILRALRCEWRE
ncbi:MAG: threonine-phosphate decarboxylase [Cyanobium sp.]|uniref:pyridoxal phosphate-dependent aminotransferase n=1 Tax=Synechococcus sp. CS-1333 TaxID=2848638 RepID=UPI000DBBBE45|nr:aminotransferase class I/II-fold pyridoxal phosphate-dependent enzyme [Synechococcus sp. CS-1333]MCT0210604.1 aminotransferase class I/II-fold pyridoxal phosphate-dependent enzyme [Synechococcus sp. CS-1333]PZV23096.1 MAG: threonine-phosphate decarboxylase [Cyanobium sp.]